MAVHEPGSCCTYLKLRPRRCTAWTGFQQCGQKPVVSSDHFCGDHWGYLCSDHASVPPKSRVYHVDEPKRRLRYALEAK